MRCLVPVAVDSPKSRLASVLSASERRAFARAMCVDVLSTLTAAGCQPTVLATRPINDDRIITRATVTVDDRPLTAAINAQLADGKPTLIVMADLPLIEPSDIRRLCENSADITIAPGVGGGTNGLAVRESKFRVDYHGASYLDHCRTADALGATVETIDSRRFATDVDEPADLAEVLIHGEGAAASWLTAAGFELKTTDGRVGVTRQ